MTPVLSLIAQPMAQSQHFDKVRLYCFSPGPFLKNRDPIQLVADQIRGGADVIQLREKQLSKKDRLALGLEIRELTRREGVLFIVNDDVDLAYILDADGVHLGQDDMPIQNARVLMGNRIIGLSTHSITQVEDAVLAGADYIGVGPIFGTATKSDAEPVVGLELLGHIQGSCPIPYVAIGGITSKNIADVVSVGCRRVAVISDILLAPNIEKRCRTLRNHLV
jgi:thiamine-phosphate pyrophosphorylase